MAELTLIVKMYPSTQGECYTVELGCMELPAPLSAWEGNGRLFSVIQKRQWGMRPTSLIWALEMCLEFGGGGWDPPSKFKVYKALEKRHLTSLSVNGLEFENSSWAYGKSPSF